MSDYLGIDLNGLVDGVFKLTDADGGESGQGEIPSVVVLPKSYGRRPWTVVGGAEAIRAIEGQGWEWPDSARNLPDGRSLRVPISEIIRSLVDGGTLATAAGEFEAADLMAAAFISLRDQAVGNADHPVMVLRDNGRYDELIQQRLLDAMAKRKTSATLLWRPVASLLGILKDLGPSVAKLYGKRVGIVSIMADGIDVVSMATEKKQDFQGEYLVPVRDRAGIHLPFDRTLFDCAREVATRIMPSDPAKGWQVLWGNGLALQHLVGMRPTPRLLQIEGKWVLSEPAADWAVSLPRLDQTRFQAAKGMLKGISLLVFEGPASEARGADGKWLTYQIEEVLALGMPVGFRGRRDTFVAARGAAEYARRKCLHRHAYYDFLPQIRIVASVENTPTFVPIIPGDARVEGGTTFKPRPLDLGLVVKPNAGRLDVYLTREGDAHPRKAVIEIPSPPTEAVRVLLGIEQRPVQGLARLTLIPEVSGSLPVIELDWNRMLPDERTEEQILDDLKVDPTKVPPLAPVEAHWAMWNHEIEGLLKNLQRQLQESPLQSCEKHLGILAKMVARRSPVRSGNEKLGDPTIAYRMVSTDGRYPHIGDARQDLADRYAFILGKLDESSVERVLSSQTTLRSAMVRIGSWSFLSCPDAIRRHLFALARRKKVISPQLDYGAMGRVFSRPEEIIAFSNFMASMRSLNRNHVEALLSVFSLRGDAGKFIDTKLAEQLTILTLEKLEAIHSTAYRKVRMPRACIKLLAGLLRHRMQHPTFLQPGSSKLADRLLKELERKQTLPGADAFTLELAGKARDYVLEQGSDSNILGQDIDLTDDDGQADDSDDYGN